MNDREITRISNSMRDAVHKISQEGAAAIARRGGGAQEIGYAIGQCAFQAACNLAIAIANTEKKASKDDITTEFAVEQMKKAICPETLTFAALYAVALFDGVNLFNAEGKGVGADFSVSTSVEKLAMALQAWEKVYPDLKAETFILPYIVEMAREAINESNSPLQAFLASRAEQRGKSVN